MGIITLWHPNCRWGMASAKSSAIWPWLPCSISCRRIFTGKGAWCCSKSRFLWCLFLPEMDSVTSFYENDLFWRARTGQNRPEPKSESMLCSAYARETSQVWVPGHLVCKTVLCFLEISVLSRYIKLNHDHFRQEHGFVWNTQKFSYIIKTLCFCAKPNVFRTSRLWYRLPWAYGSTYSLIAPAYDTKHLTKPWFIGKKPWLSQ